MKSSRTLWGAQGTEKVIWRKERALHCGCLNGTVSLTLEQGTHFYFAVDPTSYVAGPVGSIGKGTGLGGRTVGFKVTPL